MPSFEHNGLKLSFSETGTGTPVVLVPGVTGDSRLWRQVLPAFAAEHRAIAFDNRDAGQSALCPDGDYTPSDMAQDVLALLDHLGLQRAHFVGHSLGGQIVQEIALAAPARVDSLVLANTWSRSDGELDALLTIRENFCRHLPDEAFVKQALYFNFGPSFFRKVALDAIVAAYLAQGPRPPRDATLRQILAARKGDTYDRLASIKNRTLVIWSDEDRDFPKHHAAQLLDNLSFAKQHCIVGTGHCPMVERPGEFAKIVVEFLRGDSHEGTVSEIHYPDGSRD